MCAADTPTYLIARHEGEPIARATLWLTRQEPLPIANPWGRRALDAIFRRWPLLICRSPFANRPGLTLPASDQRGPALRALAQAARDAARQHHAFAALFDYLHAETTAGLAWPDGYLTMEMAEPGTFLPLTWPDFDAYLASLGKSARKDYHRHTNHAADLEIVVRVEPHVTAADDALRLIRHVEAHHHTAPNPCARAMLEQIEMIEGTWLAAEIDGRLVGSGLLLPDRGAWTLALLGLDYEVQYTYFQLMYAAIRHVIELGGSVLRGGSGAYEFKQRLGFQVEAPSSIAYTITNRGMHHIAAWISSRLG